MKYFDWNQDKNEQLKRKRGISFEQIQAVIDAGGLLDVIDNPSKNFPNQKVYVVKIEEYVYYVPYVEDEEKVFLKTIIPSRKETKKYLHSK